MVELAFAKSKKQELPLFGAVGGDVCVEELLPEEKEASLTSTSFTYGDDRDLQTSASGGLRAVSGSQPATFTTPVTAFSKVQQGQNGVSTAASNPPQLLAWLDTEVKARLVTLDTKLDRLLQHAGNHHTSFREVSSARNSTSNYLETTRFSHVMPSSFQDTASSTNTRVSLSPMANPPRPPPMQSCLRLSEVADHSHHHVAFENGVVDGKVSTVSSVVSNATHDLHPSFRDRASAQSIQERDTAQHVQISTERDSMGSTPLQQICSNRSRTHQSCIDDKPKLNHQAHFFAVNSCEADPGMPNDEHNGVMTWAKRMLASSVAGGRISNALVLRRKRDKGALRRAHGLWHFLEDQESSRAARLYAECMNMFVVTTVFCTIMQSTEPPIIHGWGAACFESSVDAIFLVEFLVRFIVCPSWVIFMTSPFNLLDLMLGSVLTLRLAAGPRLDTMPKDSVLRNFFLCLLPTLRMMKTLRRFQTLHLIFKAFEQAVEALPVLLWTLMVAIMVFSTLIFWFEPRDNIPTWTTSIWLTIVTMSTVGYGDVSPVSPAGTIIDCVLIIVSVLYMAMPIGIIGQTFGSIWHDRDRILLMQQTRKRLLQWGYTAEDIPIIFSLFDEDDDGELDLPEFRKMIKEMGLGIREERVLALFDSLDVDAGGAIDDKEFVRNVFPEVFNQLYQVDAEQAEEISVRARKSVMAHASANPSMLQRAKTMEKLGRFNLSDAENQPILKTQLSMVSAVSAVSRPNKRLSAYVLRKQEKKIQPSDAVETLARRVTVRARASQFQFTDSKSRGSSTLSSKEDRVSGFSIRHSHDVPGDVSTGTLHYQQTT